MPTYEYKCEACGHQFEKFQSITASAIKKCPECGKNKVKRLLGTGAGLIFKGSGFYITDYRSENYKSGEKGDSTTPAGGDSKPAESATAGKTESTPAKPTETAKPAASTGGGDKGKGSKKASGK